MEKYIIAVDSMGGDHAPEAIVAGCIDAARKWNDIKFLMAGPEDRLTALLADAKDVAGQFEILPASEVITMNDSPMMAVRTKKDSSMVRAAEAVRAGKAHAMISAGSTGALLACGLLRVGRIRGIERPALAGILPTTKEPFMLLDCGANVDCQPNWLVGFGLMGSIYMKEIQGVENPRVGLVNVGTEPEKGNNLSKETYQKMSGQSLFQFAGNVEAREILHGACDVLVADGFDGNLILKHTEGAVTAMSALLKRSLLGSLRSKIGALLIKPALKEFKASFDYNKYGGAPLLGLKNVVIKAHGSSKAEAITSAVWQTRRMLELNVCDKIAEGVAKLTETADNTETN